MSDPRIQRYRALAARLRKEAENNPEVRHSLHRAARALHAAVAVIVANHDRADKGARQ